MCTMVFSPVFSSSFLSVKPSTMLFPKTFVKRRKNFPTALSSSSSSISELAIHEAVAASDSNSLPAVRSYENNLARLTIVGAVDLQQALTAAAADGGEAADEHISSGTSTMVVETIFPGPSDENSTISTRLFLPARKVKEKALKLQNSLSKDIFSSTSSKNILAMTFRQVVLQKLWNVELEVFIPGANRDMSNLENPREVLTLLTLNSSDKLVISVIAEVLCNAALENTERNFPDSSNRQSYKFFPWFNKQKQISSKDSSVILYNLLEHEILENGKSLLGKYNLERTKYKLKGRKLKNSCWSSPTFRQLEKIGGPEFCDWICEFVPSYILKVDASRFKDIKFVGWKQSEGTSWEVILTHSQVVALADLLDMYYEDTFTLPGERFSYYAKAQPSKLLRSKGSSMPVMFFTAVASGIFLVALSVLVKTNFPHWPSRKDRVLESSPPQTIDVCLVPHSTLESSKAEACCVSIISTIKNYYGWPGEISRMNYGYGAYIGELPTRLKEVDNPMSDIRNASSISTSAESTDENTKALQDIATYQVVMSAEKIVGFLPTNRVAVNNWAVNPLAKSLYGGKNLRPGFFEPSLKISRPKEVIVLDLLISVNPDSYFARARTIDAYEKQENVHV